MGIVRRARAIANTAAASGPTLRELQRTLADVDERAILVPRRILRRVIKDQYRLPRFRLHLPHEMSHITGRQSLLNIVQEAELGPWAGAALPDRLILLPQPEADDIEAVSPASLLTRYWRLLFHSRVHLELDERAARGEVDAGVLRRWVRRIGITEFAEVRAVLVQERLLLPDADLWSTWVEFAATYLELEYFAPGASLHYFPGLDGQGSAAAVLAEIVDAEGLFAATRPRGAELPNAESPREDDAIPAPEDHGQAPVLAQSRRRSPRAFHRLVRRAQSAASRGNLVRACILLQQARRRAPGKSVRRLRSDVRRHLAHLVGSLQAALQFSDAEADSWQDALSALVARAAEGPWGPESRLLFDLQKIGVDRERHVYAIDVWGWARSRGTQPLTRPLPCLADVLVHKHLRSALRRMTAVSVADSSRRVLRDLLHRAEARSEANLRSRLGPLIAGALEDARLHPGNVVERLAMRKLVEELIDRVLDQGFLTLGDLRDAVARNNLKAADLSGPGDLVFGDQLLRADQRMAAALDGVYRHGQSYLRAMQRLSAVAFGTRSGRLLMRYLILPFGGAFVIEVFVQHLLTLATGMEPGVRHLPTVGILGAFLLLLVNFEGFRGGAWKLLRTVGRGLRFLLRELPQRMMNLEVVQRVLRSRAYRWASRFLVRPLVVTALASWVMPRLVPQWRNTFTGTAGIFLSANLLLNSRLGRDLGELTADWMSRAWRWLTVQVVARLFWLLVDAFRASIEAIERLMSGVDEWLRFRSGERRFALVAKIIFSPFWFVVAYVVRFSVTLLIEPQINPIKHFPVVTVSHKVLIPFIPAFARVLELAMETGLAYTVATAVITAIPGIFGFLTWELRENWQIYAANRPKHWRPAVVGKHGETVRRLLVPGLYSGTIPKRYAKLRAAENDARLSGRWTGVHKHLRVLQGLELYVGRFVQREFAWFLGAGGFADGSSIQVKKVQLLTNRIAVEVSLGDTAPTPLSIQFDARKGRLLAGMTNSEAVDRLSPRQREALAVAILGLYKAAGIDLVRQEIETQLPRTIFAYDVDEQGLVVSLEESPETEIHYPLDEDREMTPSVTGGTAPTTMPVLDRSRLLFGEIRVPWERWVEVWETLQSPKDGAHPTSSVERLWATVPEVTLLP
jgi:hypothetical protein